MYDDKEIEEYKEHLKYLKTVDITPDVFKSEIEKCKGLISELKHDVIKEVIVYKRCAIRYKIHSLVNEAYNDNVLKDLNKLFEEALCEWQYLDRLKKVMRIIIKNKSYPKILNCFETLINLMVLHDSRYDEFNNACYLDDIKYKNFGFMPSESEKINIKKLIRDIDNSLLSMNNQEKKL